MTDDITKLVQMDLSKCFRTEEVLDNEELEQCVGILLQQSRIKDLHRTFDIVAEELFSYKRHEFRGHITNHHREFEAVEKFNIILSLKLRAAPIIKRLVFERGLTGE